MTDASLIEKLEACKCNCPRNEETPIIAVHDRAFDRAIEIVRQHQAMPVSLIDCAMALQGNERIKLGSDLQAIAKSVLDAAGVPYE